MKVGDRVKIIDTSWIEDYELGEIGIIVKIRGATNPEIEVNMGRLRRPKVSDGQNKCCWFLRKEHLELVKLNKQLHFYWE